VPAGRTTLGPDDHGEPWQLTLTFVDVAGRTQLVGVAIAAVDDDGEPLVSAGQVRQDRSAVEPLTAEAIRKLPLGRIVRDAKTRLWDIVDDLYGAPRARRPPRPVRPSRWTDDELLEVARVYEAALADGVKPRRAVASRFHLSDDGASRVIRKARDAGVLGEPPGPGKAGTTGPTKENAE
jgi:hypothetical protein